MCFQRLQAVRSAIFFTQKSISQKSRSRFHETQYQQNCISFGSKNANRAIKNLRILLIRLRLNLLHPIVSSKIFPIFASV